MKVHDVIIVGGGPIGSFTAYLLAKKGLDVVLLEKNSAIGRNVNCTGIISTECFKKFNLSENGILNRLRDIKVFSPSGNHIKYSAESIIAYIVDRGVFDSEINRKALKEGATLHLETKVEKISITDNNFKVKIENRGGKTELSSRVGVIATGFELNSLNPLFNKNKSFLYGVQTDVEMCDVKDVKVYLGNQIAPGSFAWIVPTNGKSAKIGLISKERPAEHLNNFLKNPLIRHRLNLNAYNNSIKCSPIPLGNVSKSYAKRLVVVGEAAGQVKTTTGGGIYFGLLCSEIAARTIIKAFEKNDFSEKVFKEYELRWREKLEPELKTGIYLRSIFSRLSDYQIDVLIHLISKNGLLSTIKKKVAFDWHKDLGSLLLQHIFFKKFFSIEQ